MACNQLDKLERDLRAASNKLRANSDLRASEYSTTLLGLIFLKFTDNEYRQHNDAILAVGRQTIFDSQRSVATGLTSELRLRPQNTRKAPHSVCAHCHKMRT